MSKMPRPLAGRRDGKRRESAREAFRVMRSNLLVAITGLDRPSVAVTSAMPGEGKTSTCVGIAQSLAAAGLRVVLADFDLRSPDSHRVLGTTSQLGVSDVLLGSHRLEECLQELTFTSIEPVRPTIEFLPAGQPVANPTELLTSARTPELISRMTLRADIVLIDAPPVLAVADTLEIGRSVGGVVLVVEAAHTSMPSVTRARDALARGGVNVIGVVLNRFDAKHGADAYEGAPGYGPSDADVRRGRLDERRRARA
jgi:capsular exopolysaccharide synthesis family protein